MTPSSMKTWRRVLSQLKPTLDLDLHDRFFFVGLLIAGAGGAMVSLPWTLVVIGAVLAGVGLFGVR